MFIKKILTFFERNTLQIERYRLKSYFNLINNKTDYFFSKTKLNRFLFKIIFRCFSIFKYCFHYKIDIHSIDFNLTTSCNLRCKDCASLMPYYDSSNQWTIDFQTFQKDIDKLLASVNKIYRLKLIGGEPLLVKNLEIMLDYVCSKKQIISVIITTNGKLIPSDGLCEVLCKYKEKALVELSDYSMAVDNLKYEDIEKKLKKYNIYYFISNYPWFETGLIYKRNKTNKELLDTYRNCFQRTCLSFFDGKIYNCTKAAAINRLTSYQFKNTSLINIRENNFSKEKLREFYSKPYYDVCCFCPSHSLPTKNRGIQTNDLMTISAFD